MDGVTFHQPPDALRPMPVVMVSTLTEQGAEVTLRALENGQSTWLPKAKLMWRKGSGLCRRIISKVGWRQKSRFLRHRRAIKSAPQWNKKLSADAVLQPPDLRRFSYHRPYHRHRVVDRGTAGDQDVLAALPIDIRAGVVISQHIPAAFQRAVCAPRRRHRLCAVSARPGPADHAGTCLYRAWRSPPAGGSAAVHLYICRLGDGPPVNRHRPSVDVMIRSLAQNADPIQLA